MKLRYALGLIGTASLLASGAYLAGCSDDDSVATPAGQDAGRDSTTGTDSGGGGNDSGTDSGGGSDAGDGGVLPVSCANYCAIVKANCQGGNQQYITDPACLKACALFDVGTAGATSGNTLACRQYHAAAAAGSGAAVHCPHAGPSGGAMCGTRCEALCTLGAKGACAADSGVTKPPYADYATCLSTCNGDAGPYRFAADAGEMYGAEIKGDNIQCRIYHLVTAQSDPPTSSNVHCEHGGQDTGGACAP